MSRSKKKVLVTGADGFIGSRLCELLDGSGYAVKALVCYNSFGSCGWLDNSPSKDSLEIVAGDIRDPHFCQTIVEGLDMVFHLAALIAIPYSYTAPASYVGTNVVGTLNLCAAAKEQDGVRLICVSSSEVYGTARYVPIDEKHPLQPQSPYSASKIGAEMLAMSFFHSFKTPVTVVRPFNTYGPRQSVRAVIPSIIIQLLDREERIRIGDTRPTRSFNFVDDTCAALIAVAESDQTIGEVLNAGVSEEISVDEIAKIIGRLVGKEVVFEQEETRMRPEGSEVFRLSCDSSRLHQKTGFRPSVSLEEGLGKTIEWFSEPGRRESYQSGSYAL